MTLIAFAQRQDSVLHQYYKVGQEATLNLDFQHTNLSILPSENDSISIRTHIRVIASNPNAPYAGISIKSSQSDSSHVNAAIAIGEEIQPHNDFQASCEIHIPKHVDLKIKSRYGIININALLGKMNADLVYTNLAIDTLSSGNTHKIIADYSTIIIKQSDDELNIRGTNTNVKANYIKDLITDTKFSVFDVKAVQSVKAESYTDKFILGTVDSMHITSKKSLFLVNEINHFFQGEMQRGSLTLNAINADFDAINISSTYVTSQLTFSRDCQFSINADMRYCLLKQEHLSLQEIASPNSVLYSGNYNKTNNKLSPISIISTYGDVSIFLK